MNGKHWVMYNGKPTSILSSLTFDKLAEMYGKDYLGEECNVTGKLTANLEPFVMLEQPSNPTTGETMYDPIHEEVFGESNLADAVTPHIPHKESQVWTDLAYATAILTEHFMTEGKPKFVEPTKPRAARKCTGANCVFCIKPEASESSNQPDTTTAERPSIAERLRRTRLDRTVLTEEPTLTPRVRSDIERLLYHAEIQYPESEEFIVVRGGNEGFSLYEKCQENGYKGSVQEFIDGLLIKPTLPTAEEEVIRELADAVKGVNLHDSGTYRGVMNEAKDLLNDPTAHGNAVVDTILELLGIEDTSPNSPDLVNLPEPKAKRFVITRDPVDVFSVFKLFIASTKAQATQAASATRSPDVNLAIYEESVESLKRRTFIAFGDLMNVPRLPLDYIVDNAETNVFNLSVKGLDFAQNICTIRYNDKFEYTIEVFR